jgi:uncharacterized membrane protein
MNILPTNNVAQTAAYHAQQNLKKGVLATGQLIENVSPKISFAQTHLNKVNAIAFVFIACCIKIGWDAAIKLEDKIENKKYIPAASLVLSTVVLVPQLLLKYIAGFPLSKKLIAIVTVTCLFSRLFMAIRKQQSQKLQKTLDKSFKDNINT